MGGVGAAPWFRWPPIRAYIIAKRKSHADGWHNSGLDDRKGDGRRRRIDHREEQGRLQSPQLHRNPARRNDGFRSINNSIYVETQYRKRIPAT
jgi:hypothetical protein